jgi:hypothetical protein
LELKIVGGRLVGVFEPGSAEMLSHLLTEINMKHPIIFTLEVSLLQKKALFSDSYKKSNLKND